MTAKSFFTFLNWTLFSLDFFMKLQCDTAFESSVKLLKAPNLEVVNGLALFHDIGFILLQG